MLIDSHCHLDYLASEQYACNLEDILRAAKEAGVGYILSVCTHPNHLPEILAIVANNKNICASVGLHPSEQIAKEPEVDELAELADNPVVVAIGETGLDYHYDFVPAATQRARFRTHIRAARAVNKPLIVHSREAREDTLQILREEHAEQIGGVMHCFTETWDMAQEAIEMGFYISFSGIITFKNATQLQAVAKLVPLDRMLIETDAPYLAPQPFRGKLNQPAYVHYVAKCIAELRDISYDTVAKQTSENFFKVFRLFT